MFFHFHWSCLSSVAYRACYKQWVDPPKRISMYQPLPKGPLTLPATYLHVLIGCSTLVHWEHEMSNVMEPEAIFIRAFFLESPRRHISCLNTSLVSILQKIYIYIYIHFFTCIHTYVHTSYIYICILYHNAPQNLKNRTPPFLGSM